MEELSVEKIERFLVAWENAPADIDRVINDLESFILCTKSLLSQLSAKDEEIKRVRRETVESVLVMVEHGLECVSPKLLHETTNPIREHFKAELEE